MSPVGPGGGAGRRQLRVFGAGLAGLTVAISVQEELPGWQVTVVEKNSPESNTQLSGMRFREGIANRRTRSAEEILELFTRRTEAPPSALMEVFATMAAEELRRWRTRADFVGSQDRDDWFGPQWGAPNRAGKGHGKSTLKWLKRTAQSAGVAFETGELRRLATSDGSLSGTDVLVERDGSLVQVRQRATAYVLANGASTGLLFESTNKPIHWAAHEVAFASGLPLTGATVHMVHPFGNASPAGAPRIGCMETDRLAGAEVYVRQQDGAYFMHRHITDLLERHEAHYHFPNLVRELNAHGGATRIHMPDQRRLHATVAEHYYHLGIETGDDGVAIADTDNGFAVGDASGITAWTDHQERFPGFALTKCLIDARVLTDRLARWDYADAADVADADEYSISAPKDEDEARSAVLPAVRAINTLQLRRILAADTAKSKVEAACTWAEQSMQLSSANAGVPIAELSFAIAMAHVRRYAGFDEPIRISAPRPEYAPRSARGGGPPLE